MRHEAAQNKLLPRIEEGFRHPPKSTTIVVVERAATCDAILPSGNSSIVLSLHHALGALGLMRTSEIPLPIACHVVYRCLLCVSIVYTRTTSV